MSLDLSVCIMTVNRPNSLKRTLRSLKYIKTPFKLIVVHDDHPIPEDWIHRHFKDVNLIEFTGGSIGEKKNRYLEAVDTPYFLKLDDDMIVFPNSVEMLMYTIDHAPGLGAITGISGFNGYIPVYGGHSDYRFLGDHLFRWLYSVRDVVYRQQVLCDHIPEGHTIFRTKALPLGYDNKYEVGYSHYDTQLELKVSGWRCGVTPYAIFLHNHDNELDPEYKQFHIGDRLDLVKKSRQRFKEKWGLDIVDSRIETIQGKALYSMISTLDTLRHPEIYKTRGSPLERIRGLLNV